MTLLNKPMPADKIYKIVESIFYSNMNTKISVSYKYGPTMLEEILTPISYGQFCDNNIRSLITINSITPIVPEYNIGDDVYILSKKSEGMIGIVKDDGYYGVYANGNTGTYHRSEIAKLPNDL